MGRHQNGYLPLGVESLANCGPTILLRILSFFGVWFVVFGTMVFAIPLQMEGGVDPFEERLGATLCSPIFGMIGLPTFVAGPHASWLVGIVCSAVLLLGSAAFVLFRCRTWKGYWLWFATHWILVTASSVGFHQWTIYTNQNP